MTNLEPVVLLVGWNRLRESKSFTNLVANQWGFSGTYNDMYYNSFAYDANGNITQQIRLSQSGQKIEDMVYRYKTNSSGKLLRNRLYHINDEVDASDWADDIDDMGVFENNPLLIETANNYSYDEEGRLIKDTQEGIKEIVWRVDGKVRAVIFDSLSQKPHLLFDYDAFGRRIAKHLYDNQSEVLMKTTYYLRDASGNQLSAYVHEVLNEQTHFTLKELHLYGSSHLGMVADSVNLFTHTPSSHINTILGLRYYNLSNHLGNVLTTLSDIKIPLSDDNETVSGYDAAIVNIYDYSPFGVYLDGRTIESKYMPFGFNGMQRDDELKGKGNSYDFGARMYDSRLGRWLTIDPLAHIYPSFSPYHFVAGNPIIFVDPDGRYIEYAVKGKEKRELKRAIKFQIKTDVSFREEYNQWKNDPDVAHVLRWQQAPKATKTERQTDSFERTLDRSNVKNDRITHYFDKQKVEIKKVVASRKLNSSDSGKDQFSERIDNLNITDGRIIINYQMYSLPDRITVYDQNNALVTSTQGDVTGKDEIEGPLNNVSSLKIFVNEGTPNTGSVFKLKLRIIDNSASGEKMYTHEKRALKKALRNGFEKVK